MTNKGKSSATTKSETSPSRRSTLFILGGLILVGLAAGYNWLRGLPKD